MLPQLGGLEAPRESPMAGPAAKKLEKLVADVSAIQKSHEQFATQQKVRPLGIRRLPRRPSWVKRLALRAAAHGSAGADDGDAQADAGAGGTGRGLAKYNFSFCTRAPSTVKNLLLRFFASSVLPSWSFFGLRQPFIRFMFQRIQRVAFAMRPCAVAARRAHWP